MSVLTRLLIVWIGIGFTLASTGCEETNIESGDTIERDGQPDVVYVEKGDPEMEQARDEARSTVDQFVSALESPKPSQSNFSVKVPVEEDGLVEHMWLTPVQFENGRFAGILNNEPVQITKVSVGDRVEAAADEISDWMYVDDGFLVGGYSRRLMRSRLTEEERKQLDQHMPYKIR
ncbi:YegJ family protein [Thalassoroseus pseudoceratinae]|uniref:YegJ family protein n=1 Tax=Thalassoroseus pseudoceratinae TaxID=2713176 RepID=UPI00141FC815|nr:DUF2314 domain-containing protein [Thalassoroseus pseudoceratinae]